MSGARLEIVARGARVRGSVNNVAGKQGRTERAGFDVKHHGLVLVGKKTVKRIGEADVLREATTGAAVLTRVWAVGEAPAPTHASTRPLELVNAAKGTQVRPRPELAFYRKYTEAMLRRYLRMSLSTGRVPSMLGRELFRSRVTRYQVNSFEDVVIFCLDVERCLKKLQPEELEVLRRIALQSYTQPETASLMGISLRSVVVKYGAALDRLTGIFLAARMMEPMEAANVRA